MVYVDDLIIVGSCKKICAIIGELSREFQIIDIGLLAFFNLSFLLFANCSLSLSLFRYLLSKFKLVMMLCISLALKSGRLYMAFLA